MSAERGRGELLVVRPGAAVVDARDLVGQGSPLDAAVATGLLGMVRTLGIEGAKPGWSINVVTAGAGEEAAVEETVAMLAGSSLTGQLLTVGGAKKSGLVGFGRALAQRWAPRVRVNASPPASSTRR